MKRDTMDDNLPAASGAVTRRVFLHSTTLATATLLGMACGDGGDASPAATGSASGAGGAGGAGGSGGEAMGAGGAPLDGGLDATPQCEESEDNIEGPFYKEQAPVKSDLTEEGMPGTRLTLSGSVLGMTCAPLAGALIDVWQANDDGAYDAAGFTLRGTLNADAEGKYTLKTIIPGHYLNGAQYRPAHIHVKVSAPGYVLLTTQLYFNGDPYNEGDAFIKDSLIMTLSDALDGAKTAAFDFVLMPM